MTTRCVANKELTINEGTESHDFGVTDKTKARRAVGARVTFRTQTFEAGERVSEWSNSCDFVGEPGTYYCWIGMATRGGDGFGAGQSWRECKTEAERFEQVEKYLKGAKARALKHFAA